MTTFFNANNTVTGGTINATTIGALIPSTGVFTTIGSTTGASIQASGSNTISLSSQTGTIGIDSVSGNVNLGSGTTGTITVGSSGVNVLDLVAGTSLNAQSAGTLTLTTTSDQINFSSTSGNILMGTTTTGTVDIGSTLAGSIGLTGASVDIASGSVINIGADVNTTTLNIGTGSNIGVSGITIGRNGLTTTIVGDLNITGDLQSVGEVNLKVENNHILLNSGYDGESPLSGALVINTDPDVSGGQTTVSTGGFTSITTVNVVDASIYSVGDIIIITDAQNDDNNDIYSIASINTGSSPHEITIKTSANITTTYNTFVVDTTVAGKITRTTLNMLIASPDGVWRIGTGNNDNSILFAALATVVGSSEKLLFQSGTANNISASLENTTFACMHNTGIISGTLATGADGQKKSIICSSFPNANGSVRYDLDVQPYQAGAGEELRNRIFRFTRAGQSANIMWVEIPKTATISCVPQVDMNDDEYIDVSSADNITDYRFWFNTSGIAVGPASGGRTLVEVDISSNTTDQDVATTLADVVSGVAAGADFEAVVASDALWVVQISTRAYTTGTTSDAAESVLDADFTISNFDGTWINMNTGIDLF